MTRSLLLSALLVTLALPALADTTLDRSAEACQQEFSDSRVVLSEGMVSFWESSCEITAESTDANGARDLALSCSGEGDTWTMSTRVEQTATGYRLTNESGPSDYVICN